MERLAHRALDALGVLDKPPHELAQILHQNLTTAAPSSHGAKLAAKRCAERGKPEFTHLHTKLQSLQEPLLQKWTILLHKLGDDRRLADIIRPKAKQTHVPTQSDWLFQRAALSGRPGEVTEPPRDISKLNALPLETQEALLVDDIIYVLSGYDGAYLRAKLCNNSDALKSHRGAGAPLLALSLKLLPPAEHLAVIRDFIHTRGRHLSSGFVMHALCAALRDCLREHTVGLARLQQKHREIGIKLQQLYYFLEPSVRMLELLHQLVDSLSRPHRVDGPSSEEVITTSHGGALLRLLYEHQVALAGDTEASALVGFLLERSSVPFYEMLTSWVYRGVLDDPHGEFFIVQSPVQQKESLSTDFNCDYWLRRFTLVTDHIPAFLESHANVILECGKLLNLSRECRRNPRFPDEKIAPLSFGLSAAILSARLEAAQSWASKGAMHLLVDEGRLYARLGALRRFFFLAQGDFFVHFLDSAEEELSKPVSRISVGRLQSKLELSLRQSDGGGTAINGERGAIAGSPEPLSCCLQPFNLTSQLLRVVNTGNQNDPLPAEETADKTPGLDAFTFDYAVEWPLSLVLSRNAITKYQLLFRQLFHCKHIERQLSSSWRLAQATKGLSQSPSLLSSYGLRQRMLHFLHNLEYYMMFEVLEPNWHVFILRLRASTSVDTIISHHSHFLDASLKECMLRDPTLLKLLAKLLTICVVFADQTRLVANRVSEALAACPIPPTGGPLRQEQLLEASDSVERIVLASRYSNHVRKLGTKFDDELRKLLSALRIQSRQEWNLSHLCARLDFNHYWSESIPRSNSEPESEEPDELAGK